MRYFLIEENRSLPYKGDVVAGRKWHLPGVHCPTCDETWGGGGEAWPGVDLSHLPMQVLRTLAEPHLEPDFADYERLRALVAPLLPMECPPRPGTQFGPLEGRAHGTVPAFYMPYPWQLLARHDTLERLNPEGLLGVVGFPTALRFRRKNPPELLEVQVEPHGLIHPEDLPPNSRAPCARCGRWDVSRPDTFTLLSTSLPTHLDIFRLANMMTAIVVTERFHEAVQRLGLDGLVFQELEAR